MLTEFQQRKLSHMFDVYDADKNGYLEESDFSQVGQRFDQLLNLPHDQAANWFMMFWQGLAQVAGPDGRVSREAWLAFLDQMWSQPAVYEATIEGGVAFYFTALDANGDGLLSLPELRVFFQALNMGEDLADQVFPMLDINHDGAISLAEYNQCVREFYGDDPAAAGNWLLGPIA